MRMIVLFTFCVALAGCYECRVTCKCEGHALVAIEYDVGCLSRGLEHYKSRCKEACRRPFIGVS